MTRLDYSTRTWVPIFIWVPTFIWVLIHGKPLHAGEVGAYIHGVLILYGCLLSRVYGISEHIALYDPLNNTYSATVIICIKIVFGFAAARQ